MSKNWIRLLIITAAVIVIAALAYAIYLLIISDTRVKRNTMDFSGSVKSSEMTDLMYARNRDLFVRHGNALMVYDTKGENLG